MSERVAELPEFRYHPDPLATGAIVKSDDTCLCCDQARGYSYTGPVYTAARIDGRLCPWCIADGRASARFDASFTDVADEPPEPSGFVVSSSGAAVATEFPARRDEIPPEVHDEIAHRTPGFSGWQQERWLYHCRDAAAYLGAVGAPELARYPNAVAYLRSEELSGWPGERADGYLAALDAAGQPTAYLFRCRVCGDHLAYSDYT